MSETGIEDDAFALLGPVFAGRSALLLEDDPALAEHVEARLRRAGFAVVDRFDAGEGALTAAAGRAYDIMILDRLTAGLDGLETLALRYRSAHPSGGALDPGLAGLLADLERAFDEKLAELRAHAPGATMRTVALSSGDTPAALAHGEVDLASGFLPELRDGWYQQRLFAQPPTHPFKLLHDERVDTSEWDKAAQAVPLAQVQVALSRPFGHSVPGA